MKLRVVKIFYSLQGEGGRQGAASIFIRLAGCNIHCDFCDTPFEKGVNMSLDDIVNIIKQYTCNWIVWTGGEPTLQLTNYVFSFFKRLGFLQAIESNGYQPLDPLLDYTVVSPKKKIVYAKHFNNKVNEIRLPVKTGMVIPEINVFPFAEYYFLSPIFSNNFTETYDNINYCIDKVKSSPHWRLSMQMHKLIWIE